LQKSFLSSVLEDFSHGSLVDGEELKQFPQISYLGDHAHVSTARLFPLMGVSQALAGRRVLFLDSDTLVLERLDSLITLDMEWSPVAACRDHVFPWFGAPPRGSVGLWPPEGIPGNTPYFNAGVLLYDIPNWEAGGFQQEIELALAKNSFEIVDQDTINVTLAGKIQQLAGRFNVSHAVINGSMLNWAGFVDDTDAAKPPSVMHFIGWPKPWSPLSSPTDEYVLLWRTYAKELGVAQTWRSWSPRGIAFRTMQRLKPVLLNRLRER